MPVDFNKLAWGLLWWYNFAGEKEVVTKDISVPEAQDCSTPAQKKAPWNEHIWSHQEQKSWKWTPLEGLFKLFGGHGYMACFIHHVLHIL